MPVLRGLRRDLQQQVLFILRHEVGRPSLGRMQALPFTQEILHSWEAEEEEKTKIPVNIGI